MSDVWAQLLSLPIAVLVFISGQFILMFIIQPLSKQRELIAEIAFELTYNGNKLYASVNPIPEKELPERKELCNKFRTLASRLQPISGNIFFYNILSKIRITLSSDNINNATSELIGLSNGVFDVPASHGERGYQHERIKKIRELLKIK